MQLTRRRDTPPELQLRRLLHALGLRYRVDYKPIPSMRRRADVVFTRWRVAVFVDGCFWHGCPQHGTWPKANADWWRDKIRANQSRDGDTVTQLEAANWRAVRIWQHEAPDAAAERVLAALAAAGAGSIAAVIQRPLTELQPSDSSR